MIRRIILTLVLNTLVLNWCGLVWSADVTFEEARAAYVQNIQALKVFSCTIQRETAFTDDYYDVLQQRIARYEQALPDLPPGRNRELVERELNSSKNYLAAKKRYPLRTEAAFVIGLESIQVARSPSGHVPQLPIASQAEFTEKCKTDIVLCWSLGQKPNSWMWQGTGGRSSGVLCATISSRRPQDIFDFPTPPVGPRGGTFFEPARLSAFDAFFFDDTLTKAHVVGREELNGEPVVVIERAKEGTTLQAALSINHNFFPIHIDLGSGGMVLDVESFHETPQEAYYPSRWTIQRVGADDRSAEVRESGPPGSVRYIQSIETWTVDDFQSDRPEPRLFSEIGYPAGTYCFNEDRKVFFTVGKAEEVIDTVLDADLSKQQSPKRDKTEAMMAAETERHHWLLWVNLIAIVGILTGIAVRRMRQREE